MNKQKGFTLVELLITISIIAVASVMMSMTYSMITNVSNSTTEQSMAMTQVNLASGWIARDVQSAVTIQAGTEGNWNCSIIRNHWNGATVDNETVNYIFVGDKLYRNVNSGTGEIIAQYLSNPGIDTTFMLAPSENATYILKLKAVYDGTPFSQQYKIQKRIAN